MLPSQLVFAIRRLLDAGQLSQRQISQQLNVSRGTVYRMASGRRTSRMQELPTGPLRFPPSPHRTAVRCLGCGGLVFAPCVLCATRRTERIERLQRDLAAERAYRLAVRRDSCAA